MRLVEDDKVVGFGLGSSEMVEHTLAGQSIQAHNHEVAFRARERITGPRIYPADDTELQAKEAPHFPFPVPDQPGRRHDEHSPDETPGQHLSNIETGHDGLASPSVVGQQEAEGRLFEHALIDGNALVRERIDQ